MPLRRDREDYARQEQARDAARETLAERLEELAELATAAAKAVRRRKHRATPVNAALTGEVVAAFRAMQDAEEASDIADMDLAGAQGEDL